MGLKKLCGWTLFAIALLLYGFVGQSHAQVITNYVLVVPPEFVGAPPTTEEPSGKRIRYGEFERLEDCENKRRTGKMGFADDQRNRSIKPLPLNAACLPKSEVYGAGDTNP